MVHETGLFISGGAETTRTAIARGLRVLADHPDQWEAAAADPALVPGLVEEVIRWVTPLNNFFRSASRDTKIGDQEIASGDRDVPRLPVGESRRADLRRPVHLRHPPLTRTATSRSGTARTSASA